MTQVAGGGTSIERVDALPLLVDTLNHPGDASGNVGAPPVDPGDRANRATVSLVAKGLGGTALQGAGRTPGRRTISRALDAHPHPSTSPAIPEELAAVILLSRNTGLETVGRAVGQTVGWTFITLSALPAGLGWVLSKFDRAPLQVVGKGLMNLLGASVSFKNGLVEATGMSRRALGRAVIRYLDRSDHSPGHSYNLARTYMAEISLYHLIDAGVTNDAVLTAASQLFLNAVGSLSRSGGTSVLDSGTNRLWSDLRAERPASSSVRDIVIQARRDEAQVRQRQADAAAAERARREAEIQRREEFRQRSAMAYNQVVHTPSRDLITGIRDVWGRVTEQARTTHRIEFSDVDAARLADRLMALRERAALGDRGGVEFLDSELVANLTHHLLNHLATRNAGAQIRRGETSVGIIRFIDHELQDHAAVLRPPLEPLADRAFRYYGLNTPDAEGDRPRMGYGKFSQNPEFMRAVVTAYVEGRTTLDGRLRQEPALRALREEGLLYAFGRGQWRNVVLLPTARDLRVRVFGLYQRRFGAQPSSQGMSPRDQRRRHSS